MDGKMRVQEFVVIKWSHKSVSSSRRYKLQIKLKSFFGIHFLVEFGAITNTYIRVNLTMCDYFSTY